VQADSLTKNTKTKLTVLSKGDNVIIPIPSVDRGPADERNIKGVHNFQPSTFTPTRLFSFLTLTMHKTLPSTHRYLTHYLPPVDSSESLSEIANIDIKRARKRAQSGQQVQADSLTKNTKTKLTVLSKGDNAYMTKTYYMTPRVAHNFQPSTFTPTRLTISFLTLTMHKTLPSTRRYLTHYLILKLDK
jgi:hypothetical protein